MLDSTSSSTRCIAISRSRNSPSAVDRCDPPWRLNAPVSTNHRAVKSHADFERPALAHAATPAGPLTSTHRICLDSGIMFTLCSHRQVHQTPGVQSHRRGMMGLRSVNWGEGDELPNCFLERRRLGRPLPCTIRLRAQRSDHMAVGVWSSGVPFRRYERRVKWV
jgi:hypothetical protein